MDLKFISSSKLFLCYGILGIIIYSIICTITTLISCEKDNEEKDLFKLNNFVKYFDDLTKLNCILMISFVITFALKSYFYIFTIEHLTPFHVISMPTFYLFFIHIVLGIYTIINEKDKIITNMENIILEIMACLFGLIAFSIFLEFIELNFCECNFNLKRYIVQRSNKEINNNDNDNDDESIISEEDKKGDDVLERELSLLSS